MNQETVVKARPIAQGHEDDLERLLTNSREDTLDLFKTLPAPGNDFAKNEYQGHIPHHAKKDWDELIALSGTSEWLGKAYLRNPQGGYDGIGYNRYRQNGEAIKTLRFAWRWEASKLDGNTSLIMYYSAFDNWAGENDLIDEVREYSPGVFLGIYHTKQPVPLFTPRQGNTRSAIEFFILTGPTGPASEAGLSQNGLPLEA